MPTRNSTIKQTSLFRQEPDPRTRATGETLFEAGDGAASMFAVIDGEIEILRDSRLMVMSHLADRIRRNW